MPSSHRFEEVEDGPASSALKKRARESDATEGEAALSKAQKKKQKKANGEAAPVSEDKAEPKEAKKEKKEKKEKGEKKEKEKGELKDLEGGVKIRDAKVGTGKQAKAGMTVGMRYIGKLDNGKVFDKNTNGKPVSPFCESQWSRLLLTVAP